MAAGAHTDEPVINERSGDVGRHANLVLDVEANGLRAENLAGHSSATDADKPRELSAQPTTPSGLMTTASRRETPRRRGAGIRGGNDAEDSWPRKGDQGGRRKAQQHTKNADNRPEKQKQLVFRH
ncbi:hypothetical protein PHYSODRAFT_330600 [Phytophthora sojae]|uniref:Uncharacterized protein n=1 Tax=Phytophthora sojae (strain P6497) TaxID=1094619 RepID=G4ZEL4_PHYSP|nr:hypothetical protein PHYSODRAFT_330600 [Phytophthora sojae]EGZ16537.1 hypothetical protein PHYSODRAFT_330600 [Phytophthora sojae]|eukprot:XP_009525595.1 hypothetical protein PHYSODRAFT_330600 [Phytophthora sojae]